MLGGPETRICGGARPPDMGRPETQDLWWRGGARFPDMGRPTCGSAHMVYTGCSQLQGFALGRKYSRMQSWALTWETTH